MLDHGLEVEEEVRKGEELIKGPLICRVWKLPNPTAPNSLPPVSKLTRKLSLLTSPYIAMIRPHVSPFWTDSKEFNIKWNPSMLAQLHSTSTTKTAFHQSCKIIGSPSERGRICQKQPSSPRHCPQLCLHPGTAASCFSGLATSISAPSRSLSPPLSALSEVTSGASSPPGLQLAPGQLLGLEAECIKITFCSFSIPSQF